MSYIGIVVTSVFASNALLTYGLGTLPSRHERAGSISSAIGLTVVNAIAASLLWLVRSTILAPLGFASLDVLFFALFAVPLLKFLAKAASAFGEGWLSRIAAKSDDLIVGSLVFGIALISARSGYGLPEAMAASAAAGLGFWLVSVLLEAIRERLELSDLPDPFKGAPAMLVSAGLMAMAFMGFDSIFVKGLAG